MDLEQEVPHGRHAVNADNLPVPDHPVELREASPDGALAHAGQQGELHDADEVLLFGGGEALGDGEALLHALSRRSASAQSEGVSRAQVSEAGMMSGRTSSP